MPLESKPSCNNSTWHSIIPCMLFHLFPLYMHTLTSCHKLHGKGWHGPFEVQVSLFLHKISKSKESGMGCCLFNLVLIMRQPRLGKVTVCLAVEMQVTHGRKRPSWAHLSKLLHGRGLHTILSSSVPSALTLCQTLEIILWKCFLVSKTDAACLVNLSVASAIFKYNSLWAELL